MDQFTIDHLIRLLRSAGGVADGVELNAGIVDEAYTDLGYDSLALLEMSAKIQQEFGVAIPDEDVTELKTPRQTIDYLNDRMSPI
ncbi:acyl carrier protein [Phytohabitans aurantiacus]|jgi:act minimal PKS acyl carrier protein|uniref:Actinorhodin polyketide synthase acyl carrier protein n=1 Tax=Phytohabitans aurantiacus TaxID=3016789 RepID=A0ABQ5QXZ5_9ACTN|nr:phosphopantetheine-binding protein [Phytohabitans aurantiacus]GLH99309.1 actinorhodin polyketide synthase acyl carrier protein [Phytohabitans aurantiacus]